MLIILMCLICNDEYSGDMTRLIPNKLVHIDISNRNYLFGDKYRKRKTNRLYFIQKNGDEFQ